MSGQTSSPIFANLSYRDLVALEVLKAIIKDEGFSTVGKGLSKAEDPITFLKEVKNASDIIAQTCFVFADSMDNARLRKKLKPTTTEDAFTIEKEVLKISPTEVKDGNPKE